MKSSLGSTSAGSPNSAFPAYSAVVLASETGVLDEAPENILRKGRLQPGKLFLVDLERGRIVEDAEMPDEIRQISLEVEVVGPRMGEEWFTAYNRWSGEIIRVCPKQLAHFF